MTDEEFERRLPYLNSSAVSVRALCDQAFLTAMQADFPACARADEVPLEMYDQDSRQLLTRLYARYCHERGLDL